MTDPNILVELRNVTYTHWNQTEPSLQDISLKIQRGTLTVLVGPSGSGKTTFCDLFNGVIPHLHGGELSGEVWIDGINTQQAEVKDLSQKVGRVFQDAETMFTTLYVEDEIAFGPENLCFPIEDIRQTLEQMLDLTDLKTHRQNPVWNLSGGQVQKLGLASVLAMHPTLIILDEPTANLDPAATHSVHEMLVTLRNEGITILLVTRELDEFLAFADQLVVLENGRIFASGEPRSILKQHGKYMLHQLGVWLPETTEIGIALEDSGLLSNEIPITVLETTASLEKAGCLKIIKDHAENNANITSNLLEPHDEILISAHDLVYKYPGNTLALNKVSLDIRAGEMLAIVGRNGAGKSTLAKLLVGLLKPQMGELELFGKPAKSWNVQKLANQVALVLQNPEHQFLTDTVEDEIKYSLLAQGISEPEQVQKNVNLYLEMLGLQKAMKTHPFALSAGLKRRLGVATMLVGNPKVLLVDEPTYGQDKHMTSTLMELMETIRSRGIALVMITHDMRLVQEYAERVVVMSNGQILYDGQFSGVFDQRELLQKANLRPTILHDLVDHLKVKEITFNIEMRGINTFLEKAGLKNREDKNVSR